MIPRRLAVCTLLATGLLAPAAGASGTYALDGKARTHVRFGASLTVPAMSLRTDTQPQPGDCVSDGACDRTVLRLTLPKGSTVGRFEAVAHVDRNVNVAFGLYDAKGNPVDYADVTTEESQPYDCCDEVSPGYVVVVKVARLKAGKYTMIAYDRGGAGTYYADVTYHAHPPIRQTPKKK